MKLGAALIAAAFVVIAALTIARPQHASGPSLRDFEAYYSAGATWARGADPYSLAIWQSEKTLPGVDAQRYEVLPFVGPPATLPLWAALSLLPYFIAANLWRTLLFASLLALLWMLAPLANLRRTPLTLFVLAIAALGFAPITSGLALGQLALLIAFAILAAFVARGSFAKGFAAAITCAQPNIALALAGELRSRKNALAIVFGAVIFAIVSFGIVGGPGMVNYIRALQQHGYAERFSAIQVTPTAIVYAFGAGEFAAALSGVLVAIAGVIVWLLCVRAIRDPLISFCATCALVPFVTPFFHEHDLAIAFAPAVLLVLRASPAALPIALAGALLCATNWLGLAQSPDGTVQTLLLVAAFAAALLMLRQDFSFRTLVIPAVVLVLIAAAGFAARAHLMPVWPDAMAALPAAAQRADIAAIWHAEQAATGLFARDTLWALLRCASLAGSALLVYAAAISLRSPADSKTSVQVRD